MVNQATILPQDLDQRTPELVLQMLQQWPSWIDIKRVVRKE
jgi:hypothetical protein